jgi:hypothetical protein
MMGDIFDLPFKILKVAAIIFLVVMGCIFIGYAIGHCTVTPTDEPYVESKVTDATPGDTLCKAELDSNTIAKFQKFLIQYGHDQFKIIEGTAFGTAKGVQQKTFVVVLKCVDKECNVYIVGVAFVKDNLKKIEIKSTGEKMQLL